MISMFVAITVWLSLYQGHMSMLLVGAPLTVNNGFVLDLGTG